jgi:signal transduction histidine kinase
MLQPALSYRSQLQLMKPSARAASLFILLFFIFFNGLQVYLIVERIAEARSKFGAAANAAMLFSLNEYQKQKATDSASMPTHAWIAYSPKKIDVKRVDTQSVHLVAASQIITDTVEPGFIEAVVNRQAFRSIDLKAFGSIFKKALDAKQVRADYRLDTITMQGRRFDRQMLQAKWNRKRTKEYPYSTGPMRMPYDSSVTIFAELKQDAAFIRNDLLWPLLAFAVILLISNTALVFVYKTIRKQKRINEVKTDFINNMTHEMKTPITIALAGMQALEHHVPATERTCSTISWSEFWMPPCRMSRILF